MYKMTAKKKFSIQVDVRWCLEQLLHDGRITQRDVNLVTTTARRKEQLAWHPLMIIADFKLIDLAATQSQVLAPKLTLDVLTQWLAQKAGIPLY
jgi:general secretion pathway protein E